MKHLFEIFTGLMLPILFSCSSFSSEKENEVNSTINTTKSYELVADTGSVTWDRYLHQGPMTKKVKLFGSLVDVSLDETEISSSGNVKLVKGSLSAINGKLTKGNIIFKMTTFKLNTNMENNNDDLFKTTDYPESNYEMLEIIPDSAGFLIKGQLTIAGKTNKINAQAKISKQGLKGI